MSGSDLSQLKVKQIMESHVISANPKDRVSDALRSMVENRISALPVIDARGRCVGVISSTDLLQKSLDLGNELESLNSTSGLEHEMLLERLQNSGFAEELVQEVMSYTPISVDEEASLAEACSTMTINRIHHLAVVDWNNKLRGIVSTMDILKAVSQTLS
jgi:CBS domain-containing protein